MCGYDYISSKQLLPGVEEQTSQSPPCLAPLAQWGGLRENNVYEYMYIEVKQGESGVGQDG